MLCSWGDWFETRFGGNPEDRFSRDKAQLIPCNLHIPPPCDFATKSIHTITACFRGWLPWRRSCDLAMTQSVSGSTITAPRGIYIEVAKVPYFMSIYMGPTCITFQNSIPFSKLEFWKSDEAKSRKNYNSVRNLQMISKFKLDLCFKYL